MSKILILNIALALFVPQILNAQSSSEAKPSFNCAKATIKAEKMICNDESGELQRLDSDKGASQQGANMQRSYGEVIIHPNMKLTAFDIELWEYVGLDWNSPFPQTLFWTPKLHRIEGERPLYLQGEQKPTNAEGMEIEDEEDAYYTHFRDYSGRYKVKGNLRISQSLTLKEKAPIDIMIFFDKDSTLSLDIGNFLLKSPYKDDVYNHKIVREILGENRFERFVSQRFNYETIAIEAEIGSIDGTYTINNPIYALIADYKFYFFDLSNAYDWQFSRNTPLEFGGFPMATILSFKVLDKPCEIIEYDRILSLKTNLDFNATRSNFAIPVVKGLFATTVTNENDFVVNVRDKPDSKNGKIIMQLYSQGFRTSNQEIKYDLYTLAGEANEFYQWHKTQEALQRAYFLKHKDKMINPLYFDQQAYREAWREMLLAAKNRDQSANQKHVAPDIAKDYIIFISDIVENDWAKVKVLRYNHSLNLEGKDDDINDQDYIDTFLETPSKLLIKEGYIHTNGLEPYRVFPMRK